MRLAVIPARGGSKRIPRKNVRLFAGRPMIGHAIAVAEVSGVFDRIVVSTDDDEIAEVAEAFGAEVPFRRPAALADDHAGTVPVIAHALDTLAQQGWQASQVCCLYPGVPMLKPDDLRQAQAQLDESDFRWVLSVVAFPSPAQRALLRDEQGRLHALQPEYVRTRTQDLPMTYHDAGQFCWGLAQAWQAGETPHLGGGSVVLPPWRAVDIDTPEDWLRAEALYAALGH